MKIQCDRAELSEALNSLLGIIPPGQKAKPILLNFALRANDERLQVEAMDLDLGAHVTIEHTEVLEGGELALPANRLAALIRELPERKISLEKEDEGFGACLHAGGYDLRVVGVDPAEFPLLPQSEGEDFWRVERDGFVESLRRVAVASSHDSARYQLTGVFFEVESDQLTMVATDGKRLAYDRLRVDNPGDLTVRGIVPNRVVDTLLKVLAQGEPVVEIGLREPDIHVRFGRGGLSAKLIQGNFPDYRLIVAQDTKVKVTVSRGELLAAVKAASLMTSKETASIVFSFDGNVCRLQTNVADIGDSKIEVPVEMQGDAIQIHFNPNYLIDAVRCLPEEEVRVEFSTGEKPATFRGRGNYRHMVMPVLTP